jgi:hypothetical protein
MGLFSSNSEPVDHERVAAAVRAREKASRTDRSIISSGREVQRAHDADKAAWANLNPAEAEAAMWAIRNSRSI